MRWRRPRGQGVGVVAQEELEDEPELEQSLAGRELPVKEAEDAALLCPEGIDALKEAKTEVRANPGAPLDAV
eukprot:11001055-Alexandrium_andersonii.AAC.1